MKLWLRCVLMVAVVVGVGFAAASWVVADWVISPRPSNVVWPMGQNFTPEEVTFPATDGVKLKGWFLAGTRPASAVVLLHGISASRVQMLNRALWLHDLGYSVLLYDSRGYGESERVHPTFGFKETRDFLGAVSWLQGRGCTQIGCIGFSQGAATILLASGQLPPTVKAVVAEASYTTLRRTVDDHFRQFTGLPSEFSGVLLVPIAEWKLGFWMNDVSPLREITKLTAPLYLIGGGSDTLAPPDGIRALYVAAPGEKQLWIVPNAGHGDFFYDDESGYKRRIGNFLGKYL